MLLCYEVGRESGGPVSSPAGGALSVSLTSQEPHLFLCVLEIILHTSSSSWEIDVIVRVRVLWNQKNRIGALVFLAVCPKWTVLDFCLSSSFYSFVLSFSGIFFLMILFLWEREKESMSKEERERETPHWAGSPTQGSIPGPWDHDLSRREALTRLSPPGTPVLAAFLNQVRRSWSCNTVKL